MLKIYEEGESGKVMSYLIKKNPYIVSYEIVLLNFPLLRVTSWKKTNIWQNSHLSMCNALMFHLC